MPTKISSIFRKIVRKDNINIFTLMTHERCEGNFIHLPFNFYAWQGQQNIRNWNEQVNPIPPNYHIIPFGSLPTHLELDLVLSQTPDTNYPVCKQISEALDIPLVQFWHTFPSPNFPRSQYRRVKEVFSPYINLFITEENKKAWGFENHERSYVIKHAVNTDFWKPSNVERKPAILTVANDYINRDHLLGFDLYTKIVGLRTQNQLPIFPVGNTPGFSRGANSMEEMRDIFQSHQIFLNTSLISPLPMSLLEAMSCGCAVVSTNTGMIPSIIENGVNGLLLTPNSQTMRQACIELLQNKNKCQELGNKARETIEKMFPIGQFVESWKNITKIAIN